MSNGGDPGSHMERIRELLDANRALRERLGVLHDRGGRPETLEWLEKENEILERQIATYERNRALLATEEGRLEALYKLQFLDSVPLPTWSANIQGKIVHWSSPAEKTYGYTADRAMNRNFIDLFVIDPEKKQAQDDLVCIIFGQEGPEHFNLCKDKDKNGRQIYLVTCCFPVLDPRNSEIVQAEISFDLSRLDALKEELEEMHRKHRAEEEGARAIRLARERAVIETLTRELFSDVKQHYDTRRAEIERRINIAKEKLADDTVTKNQKKFFENELSENLKDLANLDRWEADVKAEIARADTKENLENLRGTIRQKMRQHV